MTIVGLELLLALAGIGLASCSAATAAAARPAPPANRSRRLRDGRLPARPFSVFMRAQPVWLTRVLTGIAVMTGKLALACESWSEQVSTTLAPPLPATDVDPI